MKLPGGNFDTVKTFYDADQATHFMTNIFGNSELFITFAIAQIIAVVFCQGISQMLLQTYMAAKDEKTIRRSVWIAAPLNGMFGVFAVTIGLTARSLPQYAALGGKSAAVAMIVDMIPGAIAALLLAALLAAILSTFAMTTLTPATIFAMDIYKGSVQERCYRKGSCPSHPHHGRYPWRNRDLRFRFAPTDHRCHQLGIRLDGSGILALCYRTVLEAKQKCCRCDSSDHLGILNMVWSFTGLPAAIGGLVGSLPNGYITLVVSSGRHHYRQPDAVKGEPAYFKVAEYKEV